MPNEDMNHIVTSRVDQVEFFEKVVKEGSVFLTNKFHAFYLVLTDKEGKGFHYISGSNDHPDWCYGGSDRECPICPVLVKKVKDGSIKLGVLDKALTLPYLLTHENLTVRLLGKCMSEQS
jgi:hypothetical protein